MDNLKKYLPSKKFISAVLAIVILVALFFAVKGIISLISDKKTSKNGSAIVQVTVGDTVQRDSNNNGIADWEEYLWGLDPAKNGPENKEFIMAKKTELSKSGDISISNNPKKTTDNEVLSEQFFATIVSLQQTGNLNQESIDSVAKAIGQNIEPLPFDDIYTVESLTVINDSDTSKADYHENLIKLINEYSNADIGNELTLLAQGFGNNDSQALYAAKTVGDSYRSFGQEMMQIPVPKSLVTLHLSIANNYEKVAKSIEALIKGLSDPIVGMRAIITYKNYNDALSLDLEKLSGILQ
jgi:hypothetical protein